MRNYPDGPYKAEHIFELAVGISREPKEGPEGRPGGPGGLETGQGAPPGYFRISGFLAFLVALPWAPWSSLKSP